MSRIICLVDCDSFYVSCEQLDNPLYQNKPVCVLTGCCDNRGIVVSRSKEAKKCGVKMGAPLFTLKNKYPDIIFLPARMDRYSEISRDVMNCLKSFSPQIEIVSIDEAYIDLTSLNKLYNKTYVEIVRSIRKTVFDRTKIRVSIGLSTSKTLAKLASDKAKETDGIFCISPKQVIPLIGTLNIEEISGIGQQTAALLKRNGVFCVSDFIQKPDAWIRQILGKSGLELKHELLGETISLVDSKPKQPQSIMDSSVIGDFTNDSFILLNELHYHIHQACRKLRKHQAFCQTITVHLKLKNFKTLAQKQTLKHPTQSEYDIGKTADSLFKNIYQKNILYRSIGIELSHLKYQSNMQNDLFSDPIKNDCLGKTIDELEQRFGKNIIQIGWVSQVHKTDYKKQ